jgi:hypothetical protein
MGNIASAMKWDGKEIVMIDNTVLDFGNCFVC